MSTVVHELSFEQAVVAAAAAVGERGADYVYECPDGEPDAGGCWNWHTSTDEPGCIIGLMFTRLYGKEFVLSRSRGAEAGDFFIDNGPWVKVDEKTSAFLSSLQAKQDRKLTWGRVFWDALGSLRRFDTGVR